MLFIRVVESAPTVVRSDTAITNAPSEVSFGDFIDVPPTRVSNAHLQRQATPRVVHGVLRIPL